MIKYTLPIMLVATVLVAGIFAFVPINEASTVHTTIQNSQLQIKTTTDTAAAAAGTVVTIDLDAPFELLQISFECTGSAPGNDVNETTFCDATEDMDIIDFSRDGETTVQLIATAGGGLVGSDVDATLRAIILDGDATTAATDHSVARMAVSDRIAFTMVNDVTADDGNDSGYTLTVRITVLTQGDTVITDTNDIVFT